MMRQEFPVEEIRRRTEVVPSRDWNERILAKVERTRRALLRQVPQPAVNRDQQNAAGDCPATGAKAQFFVHENQMRSEQSDPNASNLAGEQRQQSRDRGDIALVTAVPLFDRQPRVAVRDALGLGAGKRDEAAV